MVFLEQILSLLDDHKLKLFFCFGYLLLLVRIRFLVFANFIRVVNFFTNRVVSQMTVPRTNHRKNDLRNLHGIKFL